MLEELTVVRVTVQLALSPHSRRIGASVYFSLALGASRDYDCTSSSCISLMKLEGRQSSTSRLHLPDHRETHVIPAQSTDVLRCTRDWIFTMTEGG